MNSIIFTYLFTATLAAPTDGVTTCNDIKTHVEWRELNSTQQNNYLHATKCLRDSGASFPNLNTTSLYEDLVATHSLSRPNIHGVPAFLPWHRAFLAIHDDFLRTKCGYEDPMPYWDWTFDSQAPEFSTVWESFGTESRGCVNIPEIGDLESNFPTPHCVTRSYISPDINGNALLSTQYAPTQIALILESDSYDEFRRVLETGPHNSVHGAIGGDMSSTINSPNDPIFYLHHRNIDRIWWKWQQEHPDIAFTYNGQINGNPVLPENSMDFQGVYPNFTVADSLNAAGGGMDGKLCYQYSNSITAIETPFGGEEESLESDLGKRQTTADGIDNTATPARSDRTELFNLRVPAPVDDKFIKENNISEDDVKKLREQEAIMEKFTNFVNSHKINIPATLGVLKSAKEKGVRSKTDAEEEEETKKNRKLVALFKNQK